MDSADVPVILSAGSLAVGTGLLFPSYCCYLPPGWLCTAAGGTKIWRCLILALVSHLQVVMLVMLRGRWPGLASPLFLCGSLLPDWAALARGPVE